MTESTQLRTLEKLSHLEKMVQSMSEEIEEMKRAFQDSYMDSLYGIWKGANISDKDIEEAKKSIFKTGTEL